MSSPMSSAPEQPDHGVASTETPPRNHAEACIDVMYGVCLNDMNERFYRRLDGLFSLTTLIGGSGAFAAFLGGKSPAIAGIIGLFIAVMAYLDREIRPAQKSERCARYRLKYGRLAARMNEMSVNQIDSELRILQAGGPPTISALSLPAWKSNMHSHGFMVEERMPFLSKMACWLV